VGLLETGSQWLAEQVASHLSNSVTFKRGSDSLTLVASRQKTTYEVTDLSGLIAKVESHDFVVQSESLLIGGSKITPQPQDRIEVVEGGVTLVFEVQALSTPQGSREQAYRPCDPWGHQLRIFTKQKEPKI
jgi:hypothetical protein